MTHRRMTVALTLAVLLALAGSLAADVRSEQKTHVELGGALGKIVNIFGGKTAREGATSTVALKGTRKMTANDTTGQIVDLGEEKVYDLDIRKKTYTVTTFADLRRQMEEAQRKAEENARKEQLSQKPEAARDPNQKDVEVDFDVKNTGQAKTVNGFSTHETVVTVTVREKGKTIEQSGGMVMTSDLWLASRIAAMKEIADFDMQYAQKLYGPMVAGASAQDMAAAMAMYPMMKTALAKMSAEGDKIDGTPILTTVTMDAVKSADEMSEERKQGDAAPSPSAPPGGLGGRLLGGLAKKVAKKDDQPSSRATVMTATTEVLKVTTDVAAAEVAIPAGFKENK
jgi:hypothetical protein